MERSTCDVLIIGMGIGAVAFARRLLAAGASVAMLPGAGRPRFNHLDGGVVDRMVLRDAFGDISYAPVHQVGAHTVFRRDELEAWAIGQIADTVSIVDNFEEARAIPRDTGQVLVSNPGGTITIAANNVVLTEGANPKIGIAARLRPDFDPEDMIHFGRTQLKGVFVPEPILGNFRTSWNAPAGYSIIPHPNGSLVSTSVRIENVMRSGRDGREVLRDFLLSEIAREHDLSKEPGEVGMELVPLSPVRRSGMLGAHNIMITFDANGSIDARSLNRFTVTLASSTEQGAMMAREWPNLPEWDEMGVHLWNVFTTPRTPYHDDKSTGFIEDGPGKRRGMLRRLLNR